MKAAILIIIFTLWGFIHFLMNEKNDITTNTNFHIYDDEELFEPQIQEADNQNVDYLIELERPGSD